MGVFSSKHFHSPLPWHVAQMEEADCLGDRIAVMAKGRLKAIGTPLRLKNRYGDGYRLTVVVRTHRNEIAQDASAHNDDSPEDPAAAGEIMDYIHQYVPSAELVSCDAGNLDVVLPFDTVADLPPLLAALESDTTGHVGEWGVSYATLEQVFLKITAESGFELSRGAQTSVHGNTAPQLALQNGGVAGTRGSPDAATATQTHRPESAASHVTPLDIGRREGTPASRSRVTPGQPRKQRSSHTVRALWLKNLTLQSRQKGQCCCQVFTPVTVMLLLVMLQCVPCVVLRASSTSSLAYSRAHTRSCVCLRAPLWLRLRLAGKS